MRVRLPHNATFDAVNQLESTAGFLGVPLAIDASVATAAAGKTIKAKFLG